MRFSVCIITGRKASGVEWLKDSVLRELPDAKVLVVDFYGRPIEGATVVKPKPCVWQGEHRLTNENWWAVSNARNTALCLVETEWVLFLDDRGVLLPGFSTAIKEAIAGKYVLCGAYQKRTGMQVENGIITHGGTITGEDSRKSYIATNHIPIPFRAPGAWFFGCVNLLPLEWALQVNGWPEQCDGMSFEDVIMGMTLENNNFPIQYDPRIMLVEDRTPDDSDPHFKRSSKERHPNDTSDKAHTMLRRVKSMKRSENPFGEIRELRKSALAGNPFPVNPGPERDWFDGQLIREIL